MKVVCPSCGESIDTRGFITHTMKKHNYNIEDARKIFNELKNKGVDKNITSTQPIGASVVYQAPPIKLNEGGLPIANPDSQPIVTIKHGEKKVISMELGKKENLKGVLRQLLARINRLPPEKREILMPEREEITSFRRKLTTSSIMEEEVTEIENRIEDDIKPLIEEQEKEIKKLLKLETKTKTTSPVETKTDIDKLIGYLQGEEGSGVDAKGEIAKLLIEERRQRIEEQKQRLEKGKIEIEKMRKDLKETEEEKIPYPVFDNKGNIKEYTKVPISVYTMLQQQSAPKVEENPLVDVIYEGTTTKIPKSQVGAWIMMMKDRERDQENLKMQRELEKERNKREADMREYLQKQVQNVENQLTTIKAEKKTETEVLRDFVERKKLYEDLSLGGSNKADKDIQLEKLKQDNQHWQEEFEYKKEEKKQNYQEDIVKAIIGTGEKEESGGVVGKIIENLPKIKDALSGRGGQNTQGSSFMQPVNYLDESGKTHMGFRNVNSGEVFDSSGNQLMFENPPQTPPSAQVQSNSLDDETKKKINDWKNKTTGTENEKTGGGVKSGG